MRRQRHPAVALCLAVVLIGLGRAPSQEARAGGPPNPIYVDQSATGANDGKTWADAKTDLQEALKMALAGIEIWVAEGTYTPGADRTATFQLKDGVKLYGGFPAGGGDGTFTARDWETHFTILSGDIGVPGEENDNVYHVVTGSGALGTTLLDGFTITKGYADSPDAPDDCGGGMYTFHGTPHLANVTFLDNHADEQGGGMYNLESSPVLTDVSFVENETWHDGGGMCNDFQSNPLLTDVVLQGNRAESEGGGMYNDFSRPVLTNVTFDDNSAFGGGGGMYNKVSTVTLNDVTFADNSAGHKGGGMYNELSDPTLTRVSFSGNCAWIDYQLFTLGSGGAMYNTESDPVLVDVTFSGNWVAKEGGAVFNQDSSPSLKNVTFSGNQAGAEGGAMSNEVDSAPTLTNVTLSGNTADTLGGALRNIGHSTPTLTNCILWGNVAQSAGDQVSNSESTPIISYSDVQGSGGSAGWDASLGTDGGGNLDADPHFVDADGADDVAGSADDDLRLGSASPAIDAGDNDAVPPGVTTDLAGDARFVDIPGVPDTGNGVPPIVDMGAYEATNHPPMAADDGYTTAEDTPLTVVAPGVLENDSDPDGDPLTAVKNSDPVIGTLTLDAHGAFMYSPAPQHHGVVTFTYHAHDGTTSSNVATVAITITAFNDPPTISDVPNQVTSPGTPVGPVPFTVEDEETPPDALTLSGRSSDTALVSVGNIVFGGSGPSRTVTVTPAAGRTGTTTITITVDDGTDTASDTFALTVEPFRLYLPLVVRY